MAGFDSISASLVLRSATPDDAPTLFDLVKELSVYERLAHEVTGDADRLAEHLTGPRPYVEAILAEVEGRSVGFALFFYNYSTFLTKPGIYLEDLFVQPDYRGRGIGKALLSRLGQIALERNCGRVEWSVLDWNEPAIAFYENMGATLMQEWRICRVTGEAIANLAAKSSLNG